MAVTLKRLISGSQLTTSAATYYTVPSAGASARIDRMTLTNTTTSVVTATVYLVPSGGSAGSTNTLISAKGLAGGETYNCPEVTGQVLAAGGFIQALSNTAASLTIVASGVEVT